MDLTPLDPREQDLLRRTMGLRCQQARERLGLSQRALARVMDRSPSWVREVEQGEQWPPPYLLSTLARAAGVPVGWFYGDAEPDLEALARRLIDHLTAEGAERPTEAGRVGA
ncbi:MAG: helix-turn-helix transcriptional regulator [Planctomycetes bacterium]|nr:helix-turn-helix transcriptional regulator [Planctomycetota bacterium]